MGYFPEDIDMKKSIVAVMAFCVAAAVAPRAQADDRAVWGAVAGAVIGYQLSRDRGHNPTVGVVIGGLGGYHQGYYPRHPHQGGYYPGAVPAPHYHNHGYYVPPLVCHKIPVYDGWGRLMHYQQICRR